MVVEDEEENAILGNSFFGAFASGSRAARADVSSSRIQCNNPSSYFSDFLGDLRLFSICVFQLISSIDRGVPRHSQQLSRRVEIFAEQHPNSAMASFQHPILCLQHVKRPSQGLSDLLVASAGRHIYSYATANGQRLDVWPKNVDPSSEPDASATSTSEGQARPEKRRKISSSEDQTAETPAPTTKSAKQAWTNIPLLVVSADGKYLVAVTAEDKAIRVLEIDADGHLRELSAR